MEKLGVIRPDVTPELAHDNLNNAPDDCKQAENVDNKERQIEALDNDFRKKAANQITGQLNT